MMWKKIFLKTKQNPPKKKAKKPTYMQKENPHIFKNIS